jgi:hypothetical protein
MIPPHEPIFVQIVPGQIINLRHVTRVVWEPNSNMPALTIDLADNRCVAVSDGDDAKAIWEAFQDIALPLSMLRRKFERDV